MNYYLELTIIGNPELTPYQIWSKLYTQLHLAFVEQKDAQDKTVYGVSFPQYRTLADKKIAYLGYKLRVFAPTEQALSALNLDKWLERLVDYIHISSIRSVPNDIKGYANYYRATPKMILDERITHQAKRHGVPYHKAAECFENYKEQSLVYPHIQLTSQTNHQSYPLYIGKQTAEVLTDGRFGTYGLSRTSSVPEF
ncbi:CRISPR-associated protein, Csy4 family [Moraxella catarrhalis]|uniref:type I-F CRISPR-associated endoribonuclease Cas6/Csy4 n=1 Tax=Moraxella catarrhalis TaxID=480 RepID=UPI0007E43B52|nr:type I-F CRISPR-associated endoribonuclease Cas6/Csy4 [Moraxella catarrhalis]OAV11083.1 CRISPR-associated protein, Csy4 family [Moraxella catarrhalis]OAV12358.1 CRISPR-associated protein, Csy4 family [Moraxella catarrhalis]OAV37664.1 CRISPR-associated protein, Csy4 family [Moraxella catarrhalis]